MSNLSVERLSTCSYTVTTIVYRENTDVRLVCFVNYCVHINLICLC